MTMKSSSSLAFIAACMAAPATAIDYIVTTCADLADVDDTLATSLTIESSTFACDEYTRFPVRNSMVLKATVQEVEFGNFALKVLGDLTVEPDVLFNGVVDQVKNGGVLHVEEGATATFMGTAEFSDNTISIDQLGPVSCGEGCTRTAKGESYITKKGGAIHNKGYLTFEKDATFARNEVHTEEDSEQGKAGAISNTWTGSIMFKGKLTMAENVAEGYSSGEGGAIYNRGEIVVDGESYFSLNEASDGGAIFQTGTGKITFNGMTSFSTNYALDMRGGAIYNEGGVIECNGGSLFEGNKAYGSGDGGIGGAIYNGDGGAITLEGSTTFRANEAYKGGAIYNDDGDEEDGIPASTTTYPDDTVFEDNEADECPNVDNGGFDNCPV